jgi:hypothetical protein
MTKVQLAWVAGLLEGEGSFSLKGGGTARNIVVQCHMTDVDVLRRLLTLAGGTLHGPYSNGPAGRKQRWMWRVSGPHARTLMKRLLPLMGERRTDRITGLLAAYDAVEVRTFKVMRVATGRVFVVRNLAEWCKHNGMTESSLFRTLNGERRQCRGWRRIS